MADVTVRRLPSGYWHVRGRGPCSYAQPTTWPCSEAELRASAHPEAGEGFIRAAIDQGLVEGPPKCPIPSRPPRPSGTLSPS